MSATLKVQAALACEDLRTEMNGKWMAVGICGPELSVPAFPAAFNLRFVAIVDISAAGSASFSFRLLDAEKKIIMSIKGSIDAMQAVKGIFLPIGGAVVSLQSPGEIVLQFETGIGKWRTIQSWYVRLQPLSEVLPTS